MNLSLSAIKKTCMVLALGLTATAALCADVKDNISTDSLSRAQTDLDYNRTVKIKMASSAFPVQIEVKGRALCVKSSYRQVLPVYSRGGVFYGLFRINKGTNWINGLPRGAYFINNRKVVVS